MELVDQTKAATQAVDRGTVRGKNLDHAPVRTTQLLVPRKHSNLARQRLISSNETKSVLVHQRSLISRSGRDVTARVTRCQQVPQSDGREKRCLPVALADQNNELASPAKVIEQNVPLPRLQNERTTILRDQLVASKPLEQVKLEPCAL